jgi:hypothetical protein
MFLTIARHKIIVKDYFNTMYDFIMRIKKARLVKSQRAKGGKKAQEGII